MWGSRYFTGFFWQSYYWSAGDAVSPWVINTKINYMNRARIIGRAQT